MFTTLIISYRMYTPYGFWLIEEFINQYYIFIYTIFDWKIFKMVTTCGNIGKSSTAKHNDPVLRSKTKKKSSKTAYVAKKR